jgi:RNA polymerase sigma factor (sigma-70 family)
MHDLGRCDDAALLHARERLDVTFAVFYRRHVEAVLRFCARRGLAASEAADVTAETFATALRSRDAYRPELGTGRAWLLGIAAHRLADGARRSAREQRTQRRLALEPIALTERDLADYAALQGEAGAALAALPEPQRSAVQARVIEEQDYTTIGQRLDVSEAAARQRVSRGLAALRTHLEEKEQR